MDKTKKKIMIVEDSPTQSGKLKCILEDGGYLVEAAKDGEEALAAISVAMPDLVITDIVMPKMDGYQLCQKIKSEPRFNRIPVILLTSLRDVGDVIKGLECEADNFLTKPYEKSYLLARIDHVLTKMQVNCEKEVNEALEFEFGKDKFHIRSQRRQILNLLLSTFDAAVQRNQELALTQRELRESNKNLERSNERLQNNYEDLEAFSYTISHDLKAPLRRIGQFCGIVLEESKNLLQGPTKDYLDRIVRSVTQMDSLIEGLLSLAKVSRRELEMKEVKLSVVVQDILDSLVRSEPERKVELLVKKDLTCQGDPTLLSAVLDNLLRNAWKYSRKKPESKIEFGTTSVDGSVTYYVRDNGAGFDMKIAKNLFKPFQRLHAPSEFEGTGIGLATVSKIILRHGGKIWAEAEVEKGATFYFQLSGHNPPN